MGWEMVDEGWGHAALTWAYVNEPSFRPEYDAVLQELVLGKGQDYLDVACGSGFAARRARDRGALVSGIDASGRLLAIARARTPDGDFRVGDMHRLPWADASFDAATSFRGIWGNTPDAVIEAARVLRPGGRLGVSFWPTDLMESPTAAVWAALVPASKGERAQMKGMGSIALEGRVEAMCERAGLVPGRRSRVDFVAEFPDVDLAVPALLSSGPAYIAVQERGRDEVARALREALEPLARDDVGLRVPQSVEYLVATKPG